MKPSGTYRLLSMTIVLCYGRDDATSNGLEGMRSRHTATDVCV